MKDKGANLNIFTNVLTSIVSYVPLMLPQPYAGSYFGHVMSKCYKYAINDLKVCASMKKVSIKDVQASLQKIITWTKKCGKGKQEWARACKDANFHLLKLKTPMKTKFAFEIIFFKKTLEFKDAINLCFSRYTFALQNIIFSL
jgi:hypothetical protein